MSKSPLCEKSRQKMQGRESWLQVGCGPRITLWNRTHKRLVSEADEDAIADAEDFNYRERELLSWLKIHGEHDACSKVTLRSSNGRRGLYALREIEAGECILRVSHEIMMTPDKLPREFIQLLPNDVSEWTQLTLLLLAEKRAGRASIWAPYISCLPKWGSIHSTAFWRKEELAMIKKSSSYHETMHRRATIRAEFAAVQKVLQIVSGDSVSYASFKHAYVTVCSRAWSIAGMDKLALVPFADFLNHDCNSTAVLTYDNEKGYAELFADRSYAAGEQVVISYGHLSNASLALDFGFTLPYNPNDKAEVWFGLSRRDNLRKEKLQHLHSCGIYTLLNPDGSDSGGSSFTIREVRSTTGEGNEIPESLFTMARIICATSSKELKLACERMKDKMKEAQIMAFVLTRVEALIQQHIEAILAFQANKPVIVEGSTLSLCVEMAEAILGGELRVLRSTSAWLKHRCGAYAGFVLDTETAASLVS